MFGVVGGLDRVSWGNDLFIGKITAGLFLAKGIVNSHRIDIAGCKCMHDRFPTVSDPISTCGLVGYIHDISNR